LRSQRDQVISARRLEIADRVGQRVFAQGFTVGEIVQRLEDFKGDKLEMDLLKKHLDRVNCLRTRTEIIRREFSIRANEVQIIPFLITSDLVPMRFYSGINFPTEQVIAIDELRQTLSIAFGLKLKT
jgi:hypothetical protein